MIQLNHLAAIVPFALFVTGCASSDRPLAHSTEVGNEVSTSQQQLLAGRAIPPQGQVEISVAYCGAQKEIQTRNQVVDLGRTAEYDTVPGIHYLLTASAVPAGDGAILMSLNARWVELPKENAIGWWTPEASYMKQFMVKDSVASSPITLKIPQGESCMTVTASIRPAVAASEDAQKQTVQN